MLGGVLRMGKKTKINPVYGMSDAAFFGRFRSAIRKEWKNSKPRKDCILAARIPCNDGSKRKWLVPCNKCGMTHYLNEKITVPKASGEGTKVVKAYSVHHLVDAGSCRSFEDLAEFTRRMFCPPEKLEVQCYKCHTATHKH